MIKKYFNEIKTSLERIQRSDNPNWSFEITDEFITAFLTGVANEDTNVDAITGLACLVDNTEIADSKTDELISIFLDGAIHEEAKLAAMYGLASLASHGKFGAVEERAGICIEAIKNIQSNPQYQEVLSGVLIGLQIHDLNKEELIAAINRISRSFNVASFLKLIERGFKDRGKELTDKYNPLVFYENHTINKLSVSEIDIANKFAAMFLSGVDNEKTKLAATYGLAFLAENNKIAANKINDVVSAFINAMQTPDEVTVGRYELTEVQRFKTDILTLITVDEFSEGTYYNKGDYIRCNAMHGLAQLVTNGKIPKNRIDEVFSASLTEMNLPMGHTYPKLFERLKGYAMRCLTWLVINGEISEYRIDEVISASLTEINLPVGHTYPKLFECLKASAMECLVKLVKNGKIPKNRIDEVVSASLTEMNLPRGDDTCYEIFERRKGYARGCLTGLVINGKISENRVDEVISAFINATKGPHSDDAISALSSFLEDDLIPKNRVDEVISTFINAAAEDSYSDDAISVLSFLLGEALIPENRVDEFISVLLAKMASAQGRYKLDVLDNLEELIRNGKIPENRIDDFVSALLAIVPPSIEEAYPVARCDEEDYENIKIDAINVLACLAEKHKIPEDKLEEVSEIFLKAAEKDETKEIAIKAFMSLKPDSSVFNDLPNGLIERIMKKPLTQLTREPCTFPSLTDLCIATVLPNIDIQYRDGAMLFNSIYSSYHSHGNVLENASANISALINQDAISGKKHASDETSEEYRANKIRREDPGAEKRR